jgi:hypothetical protein
MVVIALVFPKVMCGKTLKEYVIAKHLIKTLKRKRLCTISTKQAHFLLRGGLRLVTNIDDVDHYTQDDRRDDDDTNDDMKDNYKHEDDTAEQHRPRMWLLDISDFAKWMLEADFHEKQEHRLLLFALKHLPADADIDDKSKTDVVAKLLMCLQVLGVVVQTITQLQERLDISLLEVVTIAYISIAMRILRLAVKALWHQHITAYAASGRVQLHTRIRLQRVIQERSILGLGMGILRSSARFISKADDFLACVVITLSLAFCGIHCAAWNYAFPTSNEKYMWRICFVLIGALVFVYSALSVLKKDPSTELEGHRRYLYTLVLPKDVTSVLFVALRSRQSGRIL